MDEYSFLLELLFYSLIGAVISAILGGIVGSWLYNKINGK